MQTLQKLNPHILKVVGIVNRLNIAPASLRAGVETELVEAAKELSEAEAISKQPVNRAQAEATLKAKQEEAATEKDPQKLSRIVGEIRDLKNKLSW